MTEQSEPRHEPYIELTGERKLIDGQNFYNQPPFAGAIQKGAETADLPPHDIRGMLTTLTSKFKNIADIDPNPYTLNGEAQAYMNDPYATFSYTSDGRHKTLNQLRRNAALVTVNELMPYPNWVEYILFNLSGQKNAVNYTSDGTYRVHPQAKTHFSVDTYIEWLAKRAEQDRKIGNLALQMVLEETFMDQNSISGPRELVDATGQKLSTRSFRIKEAAEVFPGKK